MTDAIHQMFQRAAERCGDRYVLTSMNRYLSSLWLAADDIDGARRMVTGATWVPPTNVYHVQHWYEMEANTEIAIYGDTVKTELDSLDAMFDALDKSVMPRLTTVHAMAIGLRGRVALRLGGSEGVRVHDPRRQERRDVLGKHDEPRNERSDAV